MDSLEIWHTDRYQYADQNEMSFSSLALPVRPESHSKVPEYKIKKKVKIDTGNGWK